MNRTNDIQCKTCWTNYGLSSTDRRSIILMVVLTSIALVICYVSVLWFAIRTRYVPEKTVDVIVHKNDVFEHDNDYIQARTTTITTTQDWVV